MILIGILGGVGSGKSAVSDRLKTLGAVVLDADRLGHEVLREPEVKEELRLRWGEAVLDEAGEIDRRKVAKIVFAATPEGQEELAFLEQLTHPRIRQRLETQLAELNVAGVRAVVLDAPVMLKAGWDRMCSCMLYVDTPRQIRLERVRQRGWTEADLAAREAAQEPVETKRSRAGIILDNSSSREHLYEQVDRFWSGLPEAAAEGRTAGSQEVSQLTTE